MRNGPIQLSDHFSYRRLLRFTLPTIGMMVFTSLYGLVDGFFVSNYAGKTAFAAVNFAWPFLGMLGVVGFMFGSGGNAIVSRLLGQRHPEKAREVFSMLVWLALGIGVVMALPGWFFLRPIMLWLGASEEILPQCVLYGRIILLALPATLLQYEFQTFLSTAEKPQLGFQFTFAAGMTNMLLDALFIGIFKWGVAGAALATALGQCVGGIGPLLYFWRPNTSLLRLTRFLFDGKALLETCINGSSELLSSISMSVISMLYNFQLMRYIGENGVAAYGTLMYVCFIFVAWFVGYCVGVSPLIGYHYGAENRVELKSLFRKSLLLISLFSVLMTAFAELSAGVLSDLYVGYDPQLRALTLRAFRVCSLSFLISGFNIFGSSLFTALGNGPVSAAISFFRTLVCEVAAVLILPLLLGIEGIWLSVLVAEAVALLLTLFFVVLYRNRYGYC
ncbi:MAG: hypothetical protein IJ154_02560 [Bacteroidales bacterium]|nr:hypothetical protein [Bacteroidales bacterium]